MINPYSLSKLPLSLLSGKKPLLVPKLKECLLLFLMCLKRKNYEKTN